MTKKVEYDAEDIYSMSRAIARIQGDFAVFYVKERGYFQIVETGSRKWGRMKNSSFSENGCVGIYNHGITLAELAEDLGCYLDLEKTQQ